MGSKKNILNTGELLSALKDSDSFVNVLKNNSDSMNTPSAGSFLLSILNENGYMAADLIGKSNLSKAFVYQILNETRTPSRDILLRIALAIGLNLDQTQKLLTIYQRGMLYSRIRRDAAIIFCIQKGSSLEQADDLLKEIGERLLVSENINE